MLRRRVTMKDIALELGLSIQSVSMALRGHHRISKATRSRVTRAAARLGYSADPALSALARYRTEHARTASKWAKVAVVSDWAEPDIWYRHNSTFRYLRNILQSETARRGITLEEHWLGPFGSQASSVFRRLFNSGIRGVLAAPAADDLKPRAIRFPRKEFQIVTFGPEHIYPDHHVVQFDYYENMRLALKHIRHRGWKRPGLVYFENIGWRTGEAWLGAYLAEKHLAGLDPSDLPPAILPWMDYDRFRSWADKYKPDALITIAREVVSWAATLPRPIPSALLDAQLPGDFGINPNADLAARSAVEMLVMEMQKSLVSQIRMPFRLHIPGRWLDRVTPKVSKILTGRQNE